MADRKWTDKARGLLMAARSLDEPAAFRLLGDAAMFSQMNLGEVLLAQRAAAIEPRRAKARQDESCARVEPRWH